MATEEYKITELHHRPKLNTGVSTPMDNKLGQNISGNFMSRPGKVKEW